MGDYPWKEVRNLCRSCSICLDDSEKSIDVRVFGASRIVEASFDIIVSNIKLFFLNESSNEVIKLGHTLNQISLDSFNFVELMFFGETKNVPFNLIEIQFSVELVEFEEACVQLR